jgi:hypothetical protein
MGREAGCAVKKKKDKIITWYLVRRVLQTPVSSIMVTRKGIAAREAMVAVCSGVARRRLGVSLFSRRTLEWQIALRSAIAE